MSDLSNYTYEEIQIFTAKKGGRACSMNHPVEPGSLKYYVYGRFETVVSKYIIIITQYILYYCNLQATGDKVGQWGGKW